MRLIHLGVLCAVASTSCAPAALSLGVAAPADSPGVMLIAAGPSAPAAVAASHDRPPAPLAVVRANLRGELGGAPAVPPVRATGRERPWRVQAPIVGAVPMHRLFDPGWPRPLEVGPAPIPYLRPRGLRR